MILYEAEKIKNSSVSYLEKDEILKQLTDMAESFRESAVYNSDAAQLRRALEEKLLSVDAGDELKKKYFVIFLICQFTSLWNAGKAGRAVLLKERTLAALANSIKVKELLEDYLIYSNDILLDDRELPGWLKAFRENQENLAGRPLREWLRGYLFSAKSGGVKRGAMERLNFINFDPEVKMLAEADKNILLKAMELLDWLEFPDADKLKSNWDVIVVKEDGSEDVVKMSEFNELKLKKKGPVREPGIPFKPMSPAQIKQSVPNPPAKPMTAAPAFQPQPLTQPKPSVPVSSALIKPTPIKPASQPIFAPTVERYDAVAEKLVKESGLNVAPELQQRFKMIVVSRLKEVRKWVETRQKLMSPLESGGIGFSYEQAEKFLKLVDEKKEGLLKNEIASVAPPAGGAPRNDKKVVATPSPLSPAPPVVPSTQTRDSSVAPLSQNDRKLATTRNDARPMPATSSDIKKISPQPLKIVQQEKAAPKVELAPLTPAQIKPAPKIAIPQTPAGRSKMEDVAYKPRLVGPVEELREMTLVDFRRLSPQAKVTADKIYAKIELLAEESYEKKIAGIKAWQESEVNKLYLGLLNESVDRAKPVQKMIEERQGAGRPSLTYEEFKTVMELNRRLRS